MMKILSLILGGMLALALTACGGGGGSPGTVVGGTGVGTTSPIASAALAGTMTFALVRADGTVVADNRLSQTDELSLRVSVRDAAGAAVEMARVVFSLDSTEAVLVPVNGVALTRAGVATIKVAPASVGSQGIVTAKATVTLNGTEVTKELFLEISPGTVQLQNMSVSPNVLQKGQSLVASVSVLVNGAAAASNSVGVSFSSTCGEVSPATALVDSFGRATAVVQTNVEGDCVVTASYNASSEQASYRVTAPPITSLEFVSASPSRIYQDGSTGVKTSIVSFKVVNSIGEGVATKAVSAALTNTDGGINFCDSPHLAVNSDENGIVRFSVCSGTLPATVQVRASLDEAPTIYTDSNLLTIQTGLPTQRFFDISATQLNYYVGGQFTSGFNGNETEISVFAADRQGNPVPPGTPIVFVAEGGQLVTSGSSSCVIGTNGRCSVRLVGQNYRPLGSPLGDPRPGRVTVLAYADGEESFVDANFNNRYDAGELFEDLGVPFMDKDENSTFSAAYQNLVTGTNEGEFIYPIGVAPGSAACPANSNVGLSAQNTCNGVWNGATKVRRQIVIIFSGGEIGQPSFYHPTIPLDKQTAVLTAARNGLVVRLADFNGNPLPSNASLSVEVLNSFGSCSARLLGNSVGNSTEPTLHQIVLDQCSGGEVVLLKAAIQGKESALSVTVP